MAQLLAYIRSLTDFSAESWQALQPALTRTSLKKGDFLLREGAVCNSLFFIERGYCRSYYEKDGAEKNTAFFFENEIATNIGSFGSGLPSDYAIKACEAMEVVVFDKQQLMQAARQHAEIEVLGRKCIRAFAARQEQQSSLFQLYSAQERYQLLEKHQPELLQRVSLTQLSSYLGISRETLSRIRKRILRSPGIM